MTAFESFGELVDPQDVPALVRAGRSVWSFGYGDEEGFFTTIDENDLWAWGDLSKVEGPGVVNSWAPFRLAPE